ncbi:hypothetical protein O185_22040 [Photorhabdus temperata J3]|uniref:Uncharacterized protein n=1 Tax=Photorhabdus temperata J3 TaxID=1389415 RepID=U7QWV8_PHOTE|nr:hypothetical protein O185_22040 [Photorhabdus temperata J3]
MYIIFMNSGMLFLIFTRFALCSILMLNNNILLNLFLR